MAMVRFQVELEVADYVTPSVCLSNFGQLIRGGLENYGGEFSNPRITCGNPDKLDTYGADRMVNSVPDSVGHPVSTDSTGFGVDSPGAVAVGESEKRCADSGIDLDALATREYFPPMVDAPIHGIHELSDCD